MGRNREQVNHRIDYWTNIAEGFARAKFKGENPENFTILLDLLSDGDYPYLRTLATLGDRDLIREQIDIDVSSMKKAKEIIRNVALLCANKGWTEEEFGKAMSLLFSGSPIIEELFDAELKADKSSTSDGKTRIERIKYVGQYLQDLDITSRKHE
jgi:hypothetical protein